MTADGISFYVHIPYCVKRCGYCDFNTYTPAELKIESGLVEISHSYIDLLLQEIEIASKVSLAKYTPTIFFGGGTPTLMEPADLGRVITTINKYFPLAEKCEVTIEANPDTVTKEKLIALRSAGFNRISFGMQSALPHVLAVLDRTHNPLNVARGVEWARAAGFDEVSVDLIYGVPSESMQDWERTVETALALPISHISAYALIVESGTKLSTQVKRGDILMPDDDETADKYILADNKFQAAGFNWYEISNWSKPGSEARHNLAYWRNQNWWGAGPGAHSHIDGKRWWNVKHPTAYREKLLAGDPRQESETLTDSEKESERVMLKIRLPAGLPLELCTSAQLQILESFRAAGHLSQSAWSAGTISLTQSGRLVADRIVREMLV